MQTFKEYVKSKKRPVVFTFGRFSVPHIGYKKVFDKGEQLAQKEDGIFKIYVSYTHDHKDNPLTYKQKVKYLHKAFPQYSNNIEEFDDANNFFVILAKLYKEGFDKATLVVGSDQVRVLRKAINKYNGHFKDGKGYNFIGGVTVVSAGDHGPESSSATKQRHYAAWGKKEAFFEELPSDMDDKDKEELYDDVRKGLKIEEGQIQEAHLIDFDDLMVVDYTFGEDSYLAWLTFKRKKDII